jgi:hypothetical protein
LEIYVAFFLYTVPSFQQDRARKIENAMLILARESATQSAVVLRIRDAFRWAFE